MKTKSTILKRMLISILFFQLAMFSSLSIQAQTGDASISNPAPSGYVCANTPITLSATFATDSAITLGTINITDNGISIGSFPMGGIAANSVNPITSPYTFTTPGKHVIKVWISVANYSDINPANDTAQTIINVQFSGTFTVGTAGNFITFKQAVDTINRYGLCGPTTISAIVGHTENSSNILLTTNTTSSIKTLTFSGNNATITALPGTSATLDGIFKIAGTDFVTITDLNLIDPIATGNAAMEWGFALLKDSANDGTQNISIKNCSVLFRRGNSVGVGIYSNNHTPLSTTQLVPTNFTGTNSYINVKNNTIDSCFIGIQIKGYNHTVSPYNLCDHYIQIGGITKGNTIKNFGGAATAYGINLQYIDSVMIQYNNITSGNSSLITSTLRGIYLGSSSNNNSADISYNIISLNNYTLTNSTFGIENALGNSGTNNIVKIYNNTIKNCNINAVGSGGFYGIYNNTTSIAFVEIYNDSVYNINGITSGTYLGIDFGASTDLKAYNNYVSTITRTTAATGITYGFRVASPTSALVYNNLVKDITTIGNTTYGLYVNGGNAKVYKNKIYNITSSNTSGIVHGIYVNGATDVNVYNNYISDLKSTNYTAASAINAINGIYVNAGTAVGLYYNTVYLNASSTGANFGTSALYVNATPTTVKVKNNIFVNNSTPAGTGLTVAFRKSSNSYTNYDASSNNNLFYSGTPSANKVIFYDGTNKDSTLALYKTRIVAPREASSITEIPPFVNTATAPYDLHLLTTTATQCESGGTPISTPAITDDFDGNVRNATTPDIGAHEGAFTGMDLTPPTISYTSLSAPVNTAIRTLVATITDASGVPRSGTGRPVLYWKINRTGTYNAVTGNSTGSNHFSFNFGAGIIAGDSVFYYVVAQDSSISININVYPNTGASGLTSNPPAVSTPPTNPSFYTFCGGYTVDAFNPYSDGFEGATFPPTCWSEVIVNTGGTQPDWSQVTVGTNPGVTIVPEGTKFSKFNSFSASSNSSSRLITPPLYINALVHPQLSFFMYHDIGYTTNFDSIVVEVSRDGASWSKFGSAKFIRYNVATPAWKEEIINMTSYPYDTVVIALRAYSRAGNNMFIDYVRLGEGPSCPAPENPLASGITQNSANLSWTTGGSSLWDIEYGISGTYTGPGTGTGTLIRNVTTNPYTLNGLTPATTYKFYVQDSCGVGDVSAWAGPFTFTTSCGVLTPPYYESFESIATVGTNILPTCWAYSNITSTNYSCNGTCNSNTAHTGTKFIGGTWSFDVWNFTPGFQLTAGQSYDFSYWFKCTDAIVGYNVSLAYGTAQNVASMTNVLNNETGLNIATWTLRKFTFTPASSGVYYFGLHNASPTSSPNGIAFDDFTLETTPTCIKPTALNTTNVSNSSATLGWTPGQSETQWQVQYTTGTTTLTTYTTTNPLTVSSLTASSNYTFKVRSICGVGDTSTWTNNFDFTTLCNPSAIPFTESFDGTTFAPTCWTNTKTEGAGIPGIWDRQTAGTYPTCTPHSGAGMARYNAFSLASGTKGILATPSLSFGNSLYEVSFWMYRDVAYANNSDLVNVYYNTNNTLTSATLIGTVRRHTTLIPIVTAEGWYEYTFNLPGSAANQNGIVIFEAVSEYGNNMFIDNVTVDEQPSCSNPSGLTARNITATSATLEWFAANGATYYNVKYQAFPFTDSTIVRHVTDTFTVANGLTPSTQYKFWVQDSCSGTGTINAWVGPYTFYTTCVAITAFSETFDAITTPNIPQCWSKVVITNNTYASVTSITGTTPNSTPNHIQLYNSSTTNIPAHKIMLISPELSNLGAGTHQLRFMTKRSATNESLIIGTMSNPADTSTFTAYTTINPTATYTEYTIPFTTYNGTNRYIAFRQGNLATYTYIYLDDINWEQVPSCPRPTLLTASTGATQAILSWTLGGSETQWQVEYTTGTTTLSYFTTYHPDTLRNLQPTTAYSFRVRAICGVGDTSIWSSSYSFTTLCNPITSLPWTENFDAITTPAFPNCWFKENGDWVTTTNSNTTYDANAHSGTQFLRDAYSATNEYIWTPTFHLTAGTSYDFSFWWAGDNYADWTGDVFVNTTQSSVGASQIGTSFLSSGTTTTMTYAQNISTFIPSSTGDYSFAIRVNEPTSNPWYLSFDDFSLDLSPDCAPASSLTASNISSTSALLHWVAGNGATYYNIKWKEAPFTDSTIVYNNVDTSYTLNGLMAATEYKYWVQDSCTITGTLSAWVGPYTFYTTCNTSTLPFTESFDGTTFAPVCWTNVKTAGTGTPGIWDRQTAGTYPTCAPHSGLGMARYNSFSLTNGTQGILVTPTLTFGNVSYEVSFWMYRDAAYAGSVDLVNVYYNTTNTLTAATLLGTVNRALDMPPVVSANGWYEYTFNIPATVVNQNGVVIFEAQSDYGNNMFIDDIYIGIPPTCLTPTNLIANNITTTSADLGWTPGQLETQWEVEYSNGTTTLRELTSTNPTTISSLTPSSSYTFKVRAICGAGDSSVWSGSSSFNTLCDAVSTFPFYEDFENPFSCWTIINNNADVDTWALYTSNPHSGLQDIALYTDYNTVNDDWLISPALALTGNQQLRFWSRCQSTGEPDELQILISTTNTDISSFTNVVMPSTPVNYTTYQETVLNLSSYSGTVYIAFVRNQTPADGWRLYIDDVSVEDIPTCPKPSILTSTNISSSSADLGWTPGGNETQWQVEYTTGTTTLSYFTNLNPDVLINLTPSSNYSFRVRAVCGVGDTSLWSNTSTFNTQCNPISSLPWTENFDAITPPAFPNCWIKENGDWVTANNASSTYDADARSGTQFLRETYSATNEFMWTPTFHLTAGTSYDFSFWWAGDDNNEWTGDVFVNTTQSSVGATQLGNFVLPTTTTTMTYEQALYSFMPPTTGDYSFAIRVSCTFAPWYLSFDDFKLELTPPCSPPNSLTASNITANSATLSWTPGTDATIFNIKYKEFPFTDSTMVMNLTDTFLVINGLNSGTQYMFWVQDSCSVTSSLTDWIGPYTFNTPCLSTTTLPYSESFENGAPSICWSEVLLSGPTANWTQETAGVFPDCLPIAGTSLAMFNSFDALSGEKARLESGLFDLSGVHNAKLTFFMYHDVGLATSYDSLIVQYTIDNGATWNNLMGLQRYDVNGGNWMEHTIDLSAFAAQPFKIGFLGISDYGNNMFIDSIYVFCIPDTASLTTTPGCAIGSVTVTSTYNGNQTFYLTDNLGNPISNWTGNAQSYEFTGLTNNGYAGKVGGLSCLSDLAIPVALDNFGLPTAFYAPNQNQDTVCLDDPALVLTGGYGLPAGGNGVYSGVGITGSQFNPTTAGLGTHIVTYTYTANGCTNDTTGIIVVKDCHVGITDVNGNIIVNIYPNPTNGKLYIEIKGISNITQMQILDIQGQLVYNENIEPSAIMHKEIDMSNYTKGIYFVKLVGNDFMRINKIVLN